MLRIPRYLVSNALLATSGEDLHELLQYAIQLEHATVPPYLTAWYSIKNPSMSPNNKAASILRHVVIEEMLHLTIVANVLNSVNGDPKLNYPEFIPKYPDNLPFDIGEGVIVNLEPLSKELVERTFLKIEEPENPIEFPSRLNQFSEGTLDISAEGETGFATIGEFYAAIIMKIQELGDAIFTGDPEKQATSAFFSDSLLFPIHNVETAVQALQIIIKQGEGSTSSPQDDTDGGLAHYYQFEQIVQGHELVMNPGSENGYSYTGDEIEIDPDEIFDLVINSKASQYKEGSDARNAVDSFNKTYSKLLNDLELAFGGQPQTLDSTISGMFSLSTQARNMMDLQVSTPDGGKHVAPSFEYMNTNI
ncbi:ferritin-like protein [Acaryochloris sp. IP29b_bin.137]|uniref:ferritin-like domain-containing protein n=1 Tax=Acaryochloris sp. IP29b_bin.137 TaxID=2969217 RepID=UPI002605CE3A|nr:ferritin-like protein [Acaryochloris sp. IP29b_bin.137]